MPFDIQGAKSAGYSDSEIADHLGSLSNFNIAGARESGYSDEEITNHLLQPAAKSSAKPASERSWSDVPADLAKGLAKGVNSVGESIVQNVDAAARYASKIDPVGKTVAYLAPELTRKMNKAYDSTMDEAGNFFAGNADNWQESKSPETQQNAKYISGGEGFLDTAGRVLERPQAIPDIIADSAAFMLPGAWVSRAMTAAKATTAAAAAGGMATNAVLDSGATGAQTKQEVLNMTPEQLIEGSPDYLATVEQAIKGGAEPEEAKVEAKALMARSAGFTAQALQLPISFLASKLTGAGKLESDFFTGKGVKDFFSSVAKEVGEEAIQEGGAQASTNAGVKAYADEDRQLSEGVGNSVALGVATGGIQGGGMKALGALVPSAENQPADERVDQPVNGEQIIDELPSTSIAGEPLNPPQQNNVMSAESTGPLTINPEETLSANSQQAPGAFGGVADYANQQAEKAQLAEAEQRTGYLNEEPNFAQAAEKLGESQGFVKPALQETPEDIELSLGQPVSIDHEINKLLGEVTQHHAAASSEHIQKVEAVHRDYASKIFDELIFSNSAKKAEQEKTSFDKREEFYKEVNSNLDAGIDRVRDAQMPENMRDVRLLRNRYRGHLNNVVSSLESTVDSPSYANELLDYGSPKAIKTAVQKALDGKTLGKNQLKIVQEVLDSTNSHTRDDAGIQKKWNSRAKNMLINKGKYPVDEWRNRDEHGADVTTHEAALTEVMAEVVNQFGIDPDSVKEALDTFAASSPSMNQLTSAMTDWVATQTNEPSENPDATQEFSGRPPSETGSTQEQFGSSPLVDNSQAEVATGRAEITAPAKRASDSEGGDAGLRQPVVEPVVEPISAIVAADNDPKAIEAEELAAAQGQTNTDDRNEHILKSMPPAILKNLKVDYPVHNEVSGQYESEKVSAKDALKSIDEDIETYKSLLNCTRASE